MVNAERLGSLVACMIAAAVTSIELGAQMQWLRKEVMPVSYQYSCAFDTRRARCVAVGKSGNTASSLEVWEWDGRVWGKCESGIGPTGTFSHELAFDEARGRFVLFTYTSMAQTWEFDGRRWFQMQPRNSPSLRSGACMTYDPVRQRVFLFGGNFGGNPLNDTWEWDGINWQQRNLISRPPPRTGAKCAFDSDSSHRQSVPSPRRGSGITVDLPVRRRRRQRRSDLQRPLALGRFDLDQPRIAAGPRTPTERVRNLRLGAPAARAVRRGDDQR